jgi:hypothetical protein
MESTKNKISPETQMFFDKLSNYLDTQLYFYGSVQRDDYMDGNSDIDVDIFTSDERGTILKLQSFLNIPHSNFKRVVNRLHTTNGIVYGQKVKYNRGGINAEFSVYNERDKPRILAEHNSKSELPYFISILLIILKFVYYRLYIMPTRTYIYLKNVIMNSVNNYNAMFVIY